MIRSEPVAHIAEQNPHLPVTDVAAIVDMILKTITNVLARGRQVGVRGFGVFSVKLRPTRIGRNPRGGAAVSVEEKHAVAFWAGKAIRCVLQGRSAPTRSRRR